MLLHSFSVENYRAFSRQQKIELRPLTLFFGWNSGGKSALVRFLPLMAESAKISGPPVWLAGDVGRGAIWSDLVCRATKRSVFRFSLALEAGPFLPQSVASWEVTGDLEGRWQEVRSLDLVVGDYKRLFTQNNEENLRWNFLLPNSHIGSEDQLFLSPIRAAISSLPSQVQWINGLRLRPPRLTTYGGGVMPLISPDGSDAICHLISAQLESSSHPLLEITRSFFDALGQQLILDNPMEGCWRVLLHPAGSPSLGVNICDTGEGFAQVLPVLVSLARACVGGPKILCLEQPELHLHTKAQSELSRILVKASSNSLQPQILVETHSEVLLMSTQLAIARGEISPEAVKIYWVESRPDGTSDAIPVDLNDRGQPTNSSLISAFDDAVRLGQELVMNQISKG